ncbi:FAD-binding protein [Acidianus sulfidivorans JP7]|uniref:FAD-dependent oxidoreductase n=1 Tax=Acidianus sulfidivorans JP7 TaxID=619593 RepID=A0A2U9IPX6_9CREN|nr:NAD(P)/FAD-dependent oxidoreductase [Acidianus sulfidivorans]AWR98065.1 FAD-binding protein [Acidianus sulfidivorans JP7]
MKFDVIVIGAGPAGSAASLIASKAGLKVITLERGPEPGSKNVSGAMVRLSEIAKVFDINGLPIEREVKKIKLILSSESNVSVESSPIAKLATISRLKFDKFLWQQAENNKALLIPKTTALGIEKVVGEGRRESSSDDDEEEESASYKVITDRGEIEGDKIILAEGVNALLSMNIGLRRELSPENTVQAVKEVYSLNKEEVSKRLNLSSDEGLAWRVISNKPIPYAGFLYTYKDSISVGVGIPMQELIERKIRPYEILEDFEKDFGINEIVKGSSLREYSAKIIPEDGFPKWKPCKDGIYAVGDSMGLINPFTFNGIGPAIISGSIAGNAAVNSWDCQKFSSELYNTREIKEIVKIRELEKEMLGKGYMSLYNSMITDIIQSWISGDLSEISQYKSYFPTMIKHLLMLWGSLL